MNPIPFYKALIDAACCAVSRTTGVPIARHYTPAAEFRYRTIRVVAIPIVQLPAFLATHPRAMTAEAADRYLDSRARSSQAAEAAMLDVLTAMGEMRARHPLCQVFLIRDTPAAG